MENSKNTKITEDDIRRIYEMSRIKENLSFQKETIPSCLKRKIINNKLNTGKLKNQKVNNSDYRSYQNVKNSDYRN